MRGDYYKTGYNRPNYIVLKWYIEIVKPEGKTR
jgi:hypothetical protein